jgi:hypothetical protein
MLMGLVADVISANRKLLEDLLYRARSQDPFAERMPDAPAGSVMWSKRRQ